MQNPKIHDSLFKWLIASFTEDFFEHYFPDIHVRKYKFIDKEFISKYEALRESLKDDLFLVMEVEIEKTLHEVVIQIEHKSRREDVSMRIYEYLCYAWLLKKRPVWSIVIYTDDAIWRKPVSDTFWYGFSSKLKQQFCHFDVIKIKSERSADLIKKHSLMCKLLALKADDRETDREALVYEIYGAAESMAELMNNDRKLLIEQWVSAYSKIPYKSVEKIKKEVNMSFAATTISEYIRNEGKIEGKIEGLIEGEIKGEIKGQIEGQIKILESLYLTAVLSRDQFEMMVDPLRMQLKEIQAQAEVSDAGRKRTGRGHSSSQLI